ncbi:hypothetical protein V8J82_10710 [Gymnodinialimonas sp. 2305UL16-5]
MITALNLVITLNLSAALSPTIVGILKARARDSGAKLAIDNETTGIRQT